jgi:hypothetical protein
LWIAINLLHYCHGTAEKSYYAVIARFARASVSDSCLLRGAMRTGTLAARAEELMHNERVIAHGLARTLNLTDHIASFFICCFAALNRFRARVTCCRNVNR